MCVCVAMFHLTMLLSTKDQQCKINHAAHTFIGDTWLLIVYKRDSREVNASSIDERNVSSFETIRSVANKTAQHIVRQIIIIEFIGSCVDTC
jgi:hypothetical protein